MPMSAVVGATQIRSPKFKRPYNSSQDGASHEPSERPPGFGLRQPSGAFEWMQRCESGGGPPQSKTLPRQRISFLVHDRRATALHTRLSASLPGIVFTRPLRTSSRRRPRKRKRKQVAHTFQVFSAVGAASLWKRIAKIRKLRRSGISPNDVAPDGA